ncbi:hypothetical protein QTP86_004832 [Hemibagrus guttatus]|nr:hypothetical protein QTP86_004832 [Hemibagrus guttatus]
MDPASSGAGGAPSQNISPSTDPAELREIIVHQDSLIRAFQAQLEALTVQLRSATAATPREMPIAHEGTKCAFLLSLLTGKALEWASAVWDADPLIRSSYSHFEEAIREVFEHPAGGKDISVQLMEIRQGSDSAADYAIWFWTLAAQYEWNDAALWAVFHTGLNPVLQTELACHVEATSLSQFVATAIRLDNLRRQRRTGASEMASTRPRIRLDCPVRALIDSGAAVNLIERALVEELGISTSPCVPSLRITAIDSQLIGEGYLRHQTELLGFQVGIFPSREADFLRDLLPGCDSGIPVAEAPRPSDLLAHGGTDTLVTCLLEELPEEPSVQVLWDVQRRGAGHIRPSTSPAAAGFFFIEKKDGGLRPCINYRGLNAITVRYPYPLPLVPAALEQLCGAWVFTKLDLRSAYNLVRIQEGDERKTAFHMTHGHYEYCVMPFGLTNTPAVFQALINEVFRDLLGRGVIAYIDDILVYSTSMEDHVRQVREVLARLQRHHLFVKLEKCDFHRTTVAFLGYVISPRGVEMNTNKVRAVSEWPAPATIKELQWFLGFANFYRRFIRSYSSVAAPLTSLLRGKPKKLNWTDQARAAFQRLNDCFTTAPILCHPDPDRPFVVEVDTSSSGLGAVLSQRHGDPGKVHPCVFYSRKHMTAEIKYDVGNRELLAIKAALEEWRHWLEGAPHPFQVLTDHRNLEYLRGAKRLNPRQARWALFFTRFQFTVSYRPGSKNGKVDALSRQSEGAGDL